MNSASHHMPLILSSRRRFACPQRSEGLEQSEASASAAPTHTDRATVALGHANLRWAFVFLWLCTFTVYARPEDIFPFVAPLHLTLIFGLGASLMGAGALLSGAGRVPWTTEIKLVLLLSVWFVAGIPFAFWRSGSLEVLTHVWLKTLLVFCLLTLTLVTLDRIRALLWAIIVSELLASTFSIFQPSKALWVGERIYGANAGFLGWNFLGIAAAMTIPYFAAIFITRRSLLSTCWLSAAFLSMMWMLVLTASRGGFLNVIFSVVLSSLLILRGSPRGRIAVLGIGMVLFIATLFAPPVFWDRLGTLWNSPDTPAYSEQYRSELEQRAAEESTEGRLELLNRSLRYTLEHPLFGLGLGNFNLFSGAKDAGDPNAWMGTHNTFTQISSEAGIPAVVIYLTLLAATARNMNKIRRIRFQGRDKSDLNLMASATLIILLSFAFGACVAHLGYDYYFFYIVAIACSIGRIARKVCAATDAAEPVKTSNLQISTALA